MEKMNENVIRRGTFRCFNKAQNMCGALFVAGLLMVLLVTILCIFDFGELSGYISTLFKVVLGLEVLVAVIWIVVSMRGDYSYEIREDEFSVTAPNGETDYFFYNDVQSVDYAPINKGRDKGYTVTITTGVRTVKYQFIFGYNAENTDTADTPFYYLEVKAGLREEIVEEIDKEKIMEQFERMSREQSNPKASKAEREAKFLDSINIDKDELEKQKWAQELQNEQSEQQPEETEE